MSLRDDFSDSCVLIEPKRVSDGEGGWTTCYEETLEFVCTFSFNNSIEARLAEQQGVTSLYTITAAPNVGLVYHDIFKRLSDGKIFRITSDGNDKQTPPSATFSFYVCTAEEYELPAN